MSIILNIKRYFVKFYLLYLTLTILSIIIDTFPFFLNLSVITDKLPLTSDTPSKTVTPPYPFRTGF